MSDWNKTIQSDEFKALSQEPMPTNSPTSTEQVNDPREQTHERIVDEHGEVAWRRNTPVDGEVAELVDKLLNLHERMHAAVRKQRPYPVKLHCNDSDTDAVIRAAARLDALSRNTPVDSEVERVAAIIDPDAFHESVNPLPKDGLGTYWIDRRSRARKKAVAAIEVVQATLGVIDDAPADFTDRTNCPGCRICDKGYYG